jgi:hypothetical protein
MADNPKRSNTSEYVRLLQNPYASLQVGDPPGDEIRDEVGITPPRAVQADRSVPKPLPIPAFFEARSGNPYARLANLDDDGTSDPAARRRSDIGISGSGFEAECRSIFRKYIPALEHGILRPEHRAFIARNRARPAGLRLRILEALRRYDLSDLGALQPEFNREDSRLTAKKLAEIERDIGKDE